MKVQYILIIENDVIDRAVVSVSLQKEGYYVRNVNNTELALKSIIKSQPFLILIDVIISKLDADTFCRILKNNEDTSDIKIIAFSDKPFDKTTKASIDSSKYKERKEQVLIDGLRIYLTTVTPTISPIIFKKNIYENNY